MPRCRVRFKFGENLLVEMFLNNDVSQQNNVLGSSYLAFSLSRVGASSFYSPCSPVLCFFCLYPFLLHVFSYNTNTATLYILSTKKMFLDISTFCMNTDHMCFRSTTWWMRSG